MFFCWYGAKEILMELLAMGGMHECIHMFQHLWTILTDHERNVNDVTYTQKIVSCRSFMLPWSGVLKSPLMSNQTWRTRDWDAAAVLASSSSHIIEFVIYKDLVLDKLDFNGWPIRQAKGKIIADISLFLEDANLLNCVKFTPQIQPNINT
jgi:hypothetical protein